MPDHDGDEMITSGMNPTSTTTDSRMKTTKEDVTMTDAADDNAAAAAVQVSAQDNNHGSIQQKQRQLEEDIIIHSIYKDLMNSVCVDIASNIHHLIKTTGGLPPPGQFMVPATNTTSYLQTLELQTGVNARRELYPEMYNYQSGSTAVSSKSQADEDLPYGDDDEKQEEEGVVADDKTEQYDDSPHKQQLNVPAARSGDEIKQLLRQSAVETPVADLLEGRLKRPFLLASSATPSASATEDSNGVSGGKGGGASTASVKTDSNGGGGSGGGEVDLDGSKSNKKFKPDPTSDEDEDDEKDDDDDDDDDDEEYKMEDDEDDGDDDDEKLLNSKKTTSKETSTVSDGNTKSSGNEVGDGTAVTAGSGVADGTATATAAGTSSSDQQQNIIANDIEDSANIVTPDIWGNYPPKEPKDFYCVCQICNRQISTSRFASHLDKCLGLSGTRPSSSSGGIGSSR